MGELDEVFGDLNKEEAQPEPTPEAIEEAPTEPQPEQVEQAPAEVVEQPKEPEERHVPLATFLDTRDKAKEAEKRASAAEARLAEIEATKAVPNAPDLYDMKPEEVAAYVERVADQKAINTKFQMSEVLAHREHGKEVVEAAAEWAVERAKADPTFAARYMSDPHPLDFIVRQHKRDSLVSQLPDDISSLDELIERKLAERGQPAPGAVAVATPAQQQVSVPAAPPKSLIKAPSLGGVSETPLGKLAGLETVFPG